jgi:hypothetical protein
MSQQTNLREFSTIAGLILKTAFSNFPVGTDVDFNAMARSMGLKDMSANLDSGRPFSTVAGHTLKWLIDNGYVLGPSVLPRARVTVTDKGLVALNNKSPLSGVSFNDEIEEASKSVDTNEGRQKLAEVVGSFFGSAMSSFTKGIAGG